MKKSHIFLSLGVVTVGAIALYAHSQSKKGLNLLGKAKKPSTSGGVDPSKKPALEAANSGTVNGASIGRPMAGADGRKGFLKNIGVPTPQQVLNGGVYHCDWTNPKTGQVTSYDGPCNRAKANMGWVTVAN